MIRCIMKLLLNSLRRFVMSYTKQQMKEIEEKVI
ncbi:hypothetical protein SAMN05421787_105112 [Virgibacillus pantothenticus]|nr:hypothetical protein SAMN05421787_105112 [Virgibacillus pantothenticus]